MAETGVFKSNRLSSKVHADLGDHHLECRDESQPNQPDSLTTDQPSPTRLPAPLHKQYPSHLYRGRSVDHWSATETARPLTTRAARVPAYWQTVPLLSFGSPTSSVRLGLTSGQQDLCSRLVFLYFFLFALHCLWSGHFWTLVLLTSFCSIFLNNASRLDRTQAGRSRLERGSHFSLLLLRLVWFLVIFLVVFAAE